VAGSSFARSHLDLLTDREDPTPGAGAQSIIGETDPLVALTRSLIQLGSKTRPRQLRQATRWLLLLATARATVLRARGARPAGQSA